MYHYTELQPARQVTTAFRYTYVTTITTITTTSSSSSSSGKVSISVR